MSLVVPPIEDFHFQQQDGEYSICTLFLSCTAVCQDVLALYPFQFPALFLLLTSIAAHIREFSVLIAGCCSILARSY